MKQWYNIKAQGEEAHVYLYGFIVSDALFDDEISPKSFLEDVAAIDAQTINVHINSPGGNVAGGIAIYNAIKAHPARVVTRIDAEAASIASIIALAGDHVVASGNAWLMVHDPWVSIAGNAAELRKAADLLDFNADILAAIYADESGISKDAWLEAMRNETWYNATQALAIGLIDEIVDELPVAACRIEPGRYRNTPQELLITTEDRNMPPKTPQDAGTKSAPQAAADVSTIDLDQVKAEAVKAERDREKLRRESIKAQAGKLIKLDPEVDKIYQKAIESPDMSVEQFNSAVVELMNSRDAAPQGQASYEPQQAARIETGVDARDKCKAGVMAALEHRCRIKGAADDAQNEYRGFSMSEIARAVLAQSGVRNAGTNKVQLFGMAMTHADSDFPSILENIANKSLQAGWDEALVTYQVWASQGTLPDFKLSGRPALEAFPYLDLNIPGAEIKHATISDTGESIQLMSYANLFSITRQALINDDVGAFSQIPATMGEAARATVNWLAYQPLINNPLMSDGVALFAAGHSNLGTAAGPSTDSVDEMRTLIATQSAIGTDAAGTANDGKTARTIGARLGYLIGGVSNEGAMRTVMESQFYVDYSNVDANIPNHVRGAATVVADPIFDGSANPSYWYGAATRRTVEVAFLDGNTSPYLESMQGWSVDGVEYKVRIDVGVSPLDYRGLVRNPWTGS